MLDFPWLKASEDDDSGKLGMWCSIYCKQHEGVSNYHTLVGPILCQIWHLQNVPYKVAACLHLLLKKPCRWLLSQQVGSWEWQQEMKMKWKWNGNWKWKLETEMGTKRTHHWCNVFFIVCLVISLVFYLAMVIGLALWIMLCLYSFTVCFVITASSEIE